jgi:hypothetical protein
MMTWMIVLIVLVVLFALVATLLSLQVVLEINSERGVYLAGVRNFCYFQVLPGEWKAVLRIAWWKREISWSWLSKRRVRKAEKRRKRTGKLGPATAWRKARRLLQSFRIRRFRLNIDTDDYILNAYLFPLFVFLNGKNRRLAINFQGLTVVDILVTNRVWKILWALIR